MYRVDQHGRRRWTVTYIDLATDKKTVSPDMKTREECSEWILRHARDLKRD